MTRPRCMLLLMVCLLAGLTSQAEAAKKKGVQLSLIPPIQLWEETAEVSGMRLAFITDNNKMTGFDLGIVNRTEEIFKGAELGILNYSRQQTYGAQFGPFNHAGELVGCQMGLINHTRDLRGVQLGLINRSGANRMLQLGILNFAENAGGWQFGLFNFNTYWNSGLPVMMFVNGTF